MTDTFPRSSSRVVCIPHRSPDLASDLWSVDRVYLDETVPVCRAKDCLAETEERIRAKRQRVEKLRAVRG